MEVYLVRHTTPKIEKGICYGQADIEVSQTFEEESKRILSELPDPIVAVYTSPLKRCLELASRISDEITQDDRLMEVDFGDWELKKWDDIAQNELDPWMKDFVNVKPPRGESAKELYSRAISFYHDLLKENYERVVVITHLGVIRMLYAHLNKISIEKAFMTFNLSYGEILRVK